MEKTQHTPGPWIAVDGQGAALTERSRTASIYTATGKRVVLQHPDNARLIAAAPELLASLRFVTAELERFRNVAGQLGADPIAFQSSAYAIARAEGRA